MMIDSFPEVQQDTIQVKDKFIQESVTLQSDTASTFNTLQSKDSIPKKVFYVREKSEPIITDTTSVCSRNIIADITFHDSNNVIRRTEPGYQNRFPFIFIEKNKQTQDNARALLLQHLKPGLEIPFQPLQEDWIILIILIAAFLFAFLRTTSSSLLTGMRRFFLFRGINDPSTRDMGALFNWQSTILNFISFLILGLFGYSAASYYSLVPPAIPGILFWFVSFFIIISAVTLRHFVCLITGGVSGETDIFNEYLIGIYHSYRFSAIVLFVIIIMMSYTEIFPLKFYFISGIIVLGTMYLIRVLRLFVIFMNRNISIFYLILYLCALEILPGLISVKYISGLV